MHTSAARALALRTGGVAYPGRVEQVSMVRADLRAMLNGCPVADDVILCASELAANAVRHSRSVPRRASCRRAKIRHLSGRTGKE
jgi:hypothetical protein